MSIGYACLTIGVPDTDLKSITRKNASKERLTEIIAYNLSHLENIIDYNIEQNIKLFRISSDLIPFGSSPINELPWWEMFSSDFMRIGKKILDSGMRVSMHPGQYTVLNSPSPDVVARAVEDLNYHAKVLDSLQVGSEHKMILHIGGVYNEKEEAMKRFVSNYKRLDESVKKRLVIENDDKSYNIMEVLEISHATGAPVIFDNLHNKIKVSPLVKEEQFWLEESKKTWKEKDGRQKIHYSQQNPEKNIGSHSTTIGIHEFMEFYKEIKDKNTDIMLEVKDKNVSAIKCIHCVNQVGNEILKKEWNKYKFSILEKSEEGFYDIQKILEKKEEGIEGFFYRRLEQVLGGETCNKNAILSLQHALGYLDDMLTEKEAVKFNRDMEQYREGNLSLVRMKGSLYRLAQKYQQMELLTSYYFDI